MAESEVAGEEAVDVESFFLGVQGDRAVSDGGPSLWGWRWGWRRGQ